MPSAKDLFSDSQILQIESSIKDAELNTSGEIRIHIENYCKGEVVLCAQKIFGKLGMHKTQLRNSVLFYVAVKDKKFAVIGDEAIDKQVPAGFWDLVRDKMQEIFLQGNFTEGLCEGIAMTGVELKKYFPISADDKNELSNEVNFGNS